VIEHTWAGYAAQKNFAIDQARGEWIINLDADEWLTEELSAELPDRLRHAGEITAFFTPMKTYYFGRWLRHGGFWPDEHLRIFKKGFGEFRFLGKQVHEGFRPWGPTARLAAPIAHEAYPTLSGYFHKFNWYTSLEAEGWLESRRPLRGYDMLMRPMHRWIKRTLIQGGWRDGVPGVLACTFAAAYDFVVALKVYEHRPVSTGRLLTTLFTR